MVTIGSTESYVSCDRCNVFFHVLDYNGLKIKKLMGLTIVHGM
jgi:hypothetical protein